MTMLRLKIGLKKSHQFDFSAIENNKNNFVNWNNTKSIMYFNHRSFKW